jgi:NADH-quinone oxidoreductase subunit I
MSYFNNIGTAIATLWEGMKVTMGYLVRARDHVTLQYPDEVWPVPSRNIGVGDLESYNVIRAKLHVNINDCIGCKQCERACPVDCITIDTIKGEKGEDLGTTSNGTAIKLLTYNFTIDMTECMFCDLCTFPCPEDCIFMTPDYQFLTTDNVKTEVTPEERWRDRDHLIYQFAKVPQAEIDRRLAAQEAAKAAAAAKAPAPRPVEAQAAAPAAENKEIPLKGVDPPKPPSEKSASSTEEDSKEEDKQDG